MRTCGVEGCDGEFHALDRCHNHYQSHSRALLRDEIERMQQPTPKEEAPCCMALVDDLGRPPIGWCGPNCERRTEHLKRVSVAPTR